MEVYNGILRLSTLLETLNRISSDEVDEENGHNSETDNNSFVESSGVIIVVVVVVCDTRQVLGDCGVAEQSCDYW